MSSSQIKIVPKGWGYEKWICNTEEYCGKLLHIIKAVSYTHLTLPTKA